MMRKLFAIAAVLAILSPAAAEDGFFGAPIPFTLNTPATGKHYSDSGANIQRLSDRLFVGGAVLNNGTNVAPQPDWLTTYQLSTGRTFGFIQVAQSAILNDNNAASANTLVVGAQTANISAPGNAIGAISVGVNNNNASTINAYGYYGEAYRCATCAGGAYGMELDPVNYNSTVTIDPFQQASGQSIALQLAAGAALSAVGQNPVTAAVNIQGNNSTFRQAINIASNALDTTGNANPDGLAMANPWSITWYNAASAKTWQIFAGSGANGNLNVSTPGSGAIVLGGSGPFAQSFNANGSGGAGYFQAPNQASAPSTPTTAIRFYADSSNRLAWKGTNGFNATLDPTANTADRNYTLPNVSGPLVVAAAGQLPGTATNDSASAGNVGEYASSIVTSGSAVSLSNGVGKDVTTISLTAGDWDVVGWCASSPAGSTTTSFFECGVSTVANTQPGGPADGAAFAYTQAAFGAGLGTAIPTDVARISVNGTTTIHLVATASFATSTMAAYGKIRARRVR